MFGMECMMTLTFVPHYFSWRRAYVDSLGGGYYSSVRWFIRKQRFVSSKSTS